MRIRNTDLHGLDGWDGYFLLTTEDTDNTERLTTENTENTEGLTTENTENTELTDNITDKLSSPLFLCASVFYKYLCFSLVNSAFLCVEKKTTNPSLDCSKTGYLRSVGVAVVHIASVIRRWLWT